MASDTERHRGHRQPPETGSVPGEWLESLLADATRRLAQLPNVVHVEVTGKSKITVVGDTHGQFDDLLAIFEQNGFPTQQNRYVFNGDFVDRGDDGCNIVVLLCVFFVLDPSSVFLNRGNHEAEGTTTMYGFQKEVRAKYSAFYYKLFLQLFQALPLATCLNRQVLVVHGGLWRRPNSNIELGSLEDLAGIDRHREPPLEECTLNDVLWSDPHPEGSLGLSLNRRRGCGLYFGPDTTAIFLDSSGLRLLVRSHEGPDCLPMPDGYRLSEDERCITVFSARNYLGQHDNRGAFVSFDTSMTPKFCSF
eukprot:GGOE01000579.1.p1 GENE.GGOE01000579.1~~GGOE01000579.1.p1  ORF type:complete len:306 (+),score=83.71 GGOE01000579.1:110-1027(+)